MTPDHCTRRYGRDTDGSEFGLCAYCDQPLRDLIEAHADGECPDIEELEEG